MKMPGFLLIGLTAIIIAADALEISTTHLPKTSEVTGTSVHGLTKQTEKQVTGTSVHNLLKKTEKPITGSSVHHITGTQKPITGSSVHHLTATAKPVTGSSVHHLTVTEKPITGSSVRHLTVSENPLGLNEKRAVCYVSNTAQNRPGNAKFDVEMVDPKLCTELVYISANISDDFKATPTDLNDVAPNGGYKKVADLKKQNSQLITVLGIEGDKLDFIIVKDMLKTVETRKKFIDSLIILAKKHEFDSVLIDLFANVSGESLHDVKENFNSLIVEFRQAIKNEPTKTRALGLDVKIPGDLNVIDNGMDIKIISDNVDGLHLTTIFFPNDSISVTQHPSPLFPGNNTDEKWTLDWLAKYVVSKGASKDKIVIGLSTIAGCYELKDPKNHDLGAPVDGLSTPGNFTQVPGQLPYFEYCSMLTDNSTNTVFLKEQQVPFFWTDVDSKGLWCGYEDQESLKLKANYIKEQKYAGYFIWNLESDDFSGTSCNQGKYPLSTALYKTLIGSVSGSVTGSVTGHVTGHVTGSLPPLTKILESKTTLTQKLETTTIRK